MFALPFEIRKDAPWFEWIYLVSTMWNVVRIWFENPRSWWKRKPIKPFLSTRGYLTIRLNNHGVKSFLLHRLLALTFMPTVLNKECINHKDWNKLNNSLNNLERCTKKENTQHAKLTLWKTIWYKEIKIKGTNITTWDEIFFDSLTDASKLGFKKPMLSMCINGKRKSQNHRWYFWTKA